ncbi:hypothetical protein CQW23_26496 [Capsicum baccatum]|uniref:ABC transporter domain-containing protein n=1 Tax=Capsicum baccatum TaxID=33114 RepID=A0A2G2VP08_CAPBA|nr:hypothetical protein CQW23_26496 [Capsicum baccatum]
MTVKMKEECDRTWWKERLEKKVVAVVTAAAATKVAKYGEQRERIGMTLLLGPPGSGKATLLKALAGVLDKDLRVNGRISYCGRELSDSSHKGHVLILVSMAFIMER